MQIPFALPQALPADATATPLAAAVGESPDLFAALFARQLDLAGEGGVSGWSEGTQDPLLPDGATEAALPLAADLPAHPPLLPGDAAVAALMMQGARREAGQPAMVNAAAEASDGQPLQPLAAGQSAPAMQTRYAAMASAVQLQPQAATPAARQALAAMPAALAATDAAEGQPLQAASDGQFPLSSPVTTVAVPSALQLPPHAVTPTAHGVAASAIPQPVGSPSWDAMLGDRVVWMVGQRHQGAELHLNPAALGPLEVKLSLSDGQATLTFATQHLPVREAIEAATPRLREMLAESGINLGSVSVNVGSFSQHAQGERGTGQSAVNWGGYTDGADSTPVQVTTAPLPRHLGMVDLFA